MKGTILDFLKLAAEKPEVAKELAELAARHGIELSDEVSDEELETVAGGADVEVLTPSQAEALLADLEEKMPTLGEMTQLMVYELQSNQEKSSQMMQTIANLLKQWDDTTKAIVNNLKP